MILIIIFDHHVRLNLFIRINFTFIIIIIIVTIIIIINNNNNNRCAFPRT